MTGRPAVSVIVPFAGSQAQLWQLLDHLVALRLRDGDEVIVADNRPGACIIEEPSRVRIVAANGLRSPGFARNRGAREAGADWLLFVDADVTPIPTLLDHYFDPPPQDRTAVLAGGIDDLAARGTLVARHSAARGHMSQRITLDRALPYAQTANCAVLRRAFFEVGGFDAQARAGEDADLCFRLAQAGWRLEARPGAVVTHHSRETIGALIGQLAVHGSGAAWLNRRYPGSFPSPHASGLVARLARDAGRGIAALGRGDPESAGFALLDVVGACAFEFGRLLPNRPRRG
jgi:GT2 family glycosyltransferase